MKETSMDMIPQTSNTVVIGSECGHMLEKEEATKFCSKCRRTLPVSNFSANKASKDGLQDRCKECKNAYMREYVKRKKQIKEPNLEDYRETKVVNIDSQEHTMCKVYSETGLAKFTPRQLMAELKARGYRWEYMLEPQRKVYFDKI